MTPFCSFFMAGKYSIVYIYHIFFNHSSADGQLGRFHVLVIVNSAGMNTGVHMSFWIMVFSGYIPRNVIAGSYGKFIFLMCVLSTINFSPALLFWTHNFRYAAASFLFVSQCFLISILFFPLDYLLFNNSWINFQIVVNFLFFFLLLIFASIHYDQIRYIVYLQSFPVD